MLGPGVDDPTLDFGDGAVCIEGPTLDVDDGAAFIEGPTLDVDDGAACIEGPTLDVNDGAVCIEGPTLDFDDGAVSIEGLALWFGDWGADGARVGFAKGELVGDGVVLATGAVAGIAAEIGGEVACVTGVTGVPPVVITFLEFLQAFKGNGTTASVIFLFMIVHLLSR